VCLPVTQVQSQTLCCSLTIREGKAHLGLMRSWMRRVELYLARDARDKRRVWRVAQTHL